jgi:ring-1,2-phenylacetyl-CoA epoxidase subunit PaaC
MIDHILYTLQLADNALIIGHRLSEWCGHGPILEQDIAITNMSLDHLGQARSYYQHAADMFNALPQAEKEQLFSSIALADKVKAGENIDEDDLAYLRDSWDFRNVIIAEQPNGDWAQTVARSFFYDAFYYLYYTQLQKSNDLQIAAVAEKSLKEVTYHQKWSAEWVIRLGDGTDVSKEKMQQAINFMWPYTGEMFKMSAVEQVLLSQGISVDAAALKAAWLEKVNEILQEATLQLPENAWMHDGGKDGRHSEHLGYILTELQFMQRTYPNMEW